MKSKVPEVLLPDHPMYTQAVDALKRYHEAKHEGLPAEEVERLRLQAESLFQAVTDYHLYALGHQNLTFH